MVNNYDKYKERLFNFWKSGYNFGVDRESGEPMECSCDYSIESRCHKCKFRLRGDCPTQRSEWLEAPAEPEYVEYYSGILNKEDYELLKIYLVELNRIAVKMCHQDPEKGFKCVECPYYEDYGCGHLAPIDLLIKAGGIIMFDKEDIGNYIKKIA